MSTLPEPRIFIGVQEISGYYSALETGFLAIGARARLVTTHPHPFGYSQNQENPTAARMASKCVMAHREAPTWLKPWFAIWYVAFSMLLLAWAIPRFDVFVFSWGQSMLPKFVDLRVLAWFRKTRISVIGHGSEARPPYMSFLEGDDAAIASIKVSTNRMARRLHSLERLSSAVIALPTTAQFLRKPFIDFYGLGVPSRLQTTPAQAQGRRTTFRIVHSPSKPALKGSHEIREAVLALKTRHPEVEYVEVTGLPHEQVIQEIAEADLVVDQIWSDIPMAVVGVEASQAGKASVICGYGWNYWDHRAQAIGGLPPSIRCAPQQLLETLEWCLQNQSEVSATAREALSFVTSKWHPTKVAANYLAVMKGHTPVSLIVKPSEVEYALGCGVTSEVVLDRVDRIVTEFGWDALCWPGAEASYEPLLRSRTPHQKDKAET